MTTTSAFLGRHNWRLLSAIFLTLLGLSPATAELGRVKVATQIGLSYLPLVIMQHDKLWEEKARGLGVPLEVEYVQLGGGAPLNDAILSDSVQIAAAGLAPMLILWDRTRTSAKVKGLSAINVGPMYLLTNKDQIRSLADFSDLDRIALPSIKVSIQAILLAMAAKKALGPDKWSRLESLQVPMAHPDAFTALTKQSAGITAYMASAPFQERALKLPGIRKILDSFEVLGGPSTFSVSYAKADFVEKNPNLVTAFMAAQRQAVADIKRDPKGALNKYVAVTGDKTDRALMEEILNSPSFDYDVFPKRTKDVADFMRDSGLLKTGPSSWNEYFFPTMNGENGS